MNESPQEKKVTCLIHAEYTTEAGAELCRVRHPERIGVEKKKEKDAKRHQVHVD
jgi:hypothetical protein